MSFMYRGNVSRLYRLLSSNGLATGDKEITGDYSGAETPFYIAPPAGEVFYLNRMIGGIVDAGSFDSGSYGNGITLTNGIACRLYRGGFAEANILLDLFDGCRIKTNTDWARACYDFQVSSFGSGDEYGIFRWTYTKDGTDPIVLDGDRQDALALLFHDDFTDLKGHGFCVRGIRKVKS